jgi:pimeloyl-ACP methyl ester carboxylesterase
MSPVIEGAGVSLEYWVRGEGDFVLLVHGMGGTEWPDDLPGRLIGYARRGYGASGAPQPYVRTTVEEQAEDAAAVLDPWAGVDAATAPAVVVGDGLGALIALDLARRHRELVRAVVAVDPPLFAFVPEAAEVLSAQRDELERVMREEGPAEAVRRFVAAAGGSPERATWAAAAFRAFFADYGAPASWNVGRRELRALEVPLVVVESAEALPHVRAASEALAGVVPGAQRGEGVREAVESLGIR